MRKLLAERFLVGMVLGGFIGLSCGLWPLGSFLNLFWSCVVGGVAGGFVGLLFPKKAMIWVFEFFK